MNCSICKKPITLKPTAEERARKYGGKASDYTKLFTTHAKCQLEQNSKNVSDLIKRLTNS